jgi:hypothetical protein
MKSKILLVSMFSLMLIVSIAGGVCVVKADTAGEPEVSYGTWDANSIQSPSVRDGQSYENLTLIILSPLPNEVLSDNAAILRVNISTQVWSINSVYYEADWQEGMHCIYDVNNQTLNTKMLFTLSITVNFTDIPDGMHHLTVYAYIHDGSHSSSSVDFTVNALPSIVILSPENKTFETTNLPLSFTVNKPMKWAGYSLDGKENITVTGNSTITSLTNGFHSITVYANDSSGKMGTSQTINFTIAKPESESFPIVATAAVLVTSVLAVGLVIYFRKRKH